MSRFPDLPTAAAAVGDYNVPPGLSPPPSAPEPESRPFTETIADAFNTVVGQRLTWATQELTFDADPNFKLDEKRIRELGESLPPSYWYEFGDAKSDEHALAIRNRLLARADLEQRLTNDGFRGTSVRLGVEVLNPYSLAAMTVGGGLGAAARLKNGASILGLVGRAGLIEGTAAGSLQSVNVAADPEGQVSSVASAFVGGAITGPLARFADSPNIISRVAAGVAEGGVSLATDTAISALQDDIDREAIVWNALVQAGLGAAGNIPPTAARSLESAIARSEKNIVDRAGVTLSAKGEKRYSSAIRPDAEVQNTLANVARAMGATADDIEAARQPIPEPEVRRGTADVSGAGAASREEIAKMQQTWDDLDADNAARVAGRRSDLPVLEPNYTPARYIKDGFLPLRWLRKIGIGARLTGTEGSKTAVAAANMFTRDVMGKGDGHVVNTFSAADAAHMLRSRYNTQIDDLYERWYGYHKKNSPKPLSYEEFTDAVGRHIPFSGTRSSDIPGVSNLISEREKIIGDILDVSKQMGVKGSESVENQANYLSRVYNRQAIDDGEMRAANLRDGLTGFWARAFMDANPDMEYDDALRTAKAHLRLAGTSLNADTSLEMVAKAATREEAIEIVADYLSIEPDKASPIVDALYKSNDPKSPAKNLRRRMPFRTDYSEVDPLGQKISASDFLYHDAHAIDLQYAHNMVGVAVMQDAFRALRTRADEKFASRRSILSKIQKELRESGVSEDDVKPLIEKFDFLMRKTQGVRIEGEKKWHKYERALRNIQFIRTMSSPRSGLTQTVDLAEIIGTHGVETFSRSRFGQILTSIGDEAKTADGTKLGQLKRDLEHIGLIADMKRGRVHMLEDALGSEGFNGSKMEKWTGMAARISAKVSGQEFVSTRLRYAAGAAATQNFIDEAVGLKKANFNNKILAAAGVTREEYDGIVAEVARQVGNDPEATFRPEMFRNQELARKYRQFVYRMAMQNVYSPDASQIPMWGSKAGFRMFMQLRTFMFGSVSAKTLYALNAGATPRMLTTVMLSGIGGAATYAAGILAESLTRDDRSEYLDKRLSVKEILKAGFSRSAYSSVLPMAADTAVADLLLRPSDSIFGSARSTGLPGGAVFGSPALDHARSVQGVVAGPLRQMFYDEPLLTKEWYDSLTNSFVPRFIGLNGILSNISRDLPRQSRESLFDE